MVQRVRNPNRNLPRPQVPYIPEYRRHGVRPVPIDEQGRVDEEQLEYDDEPASFRGGLPLSVGDHNEASFLVDGNNESEYEVPEPVPQRQRGPRQSHSRNSPKTPGQIAPGEYLLLVNGQVVGSGSEEHVKKAVTSLIYNQSLNPSDMIVLKRMEVDFGVTLK